MCVFFIFYIFLSCDLVQSDELVSVPCSSDFDIVQNKALKFGVITFLVQSLC